MGGRCSTPTARSRARAPLAPATATTPRASAAPARAWASSRPLATGAHAHAHLTQKDASPAVLGQQRAVCTRTAGRRAGRWHTSWHIPWMLASTVRRRLAHTQFLAGAWRQKPRAGQPGRWGQRGEGGAQQHGLAQARARCRVARCAGARRTHPVAPRTPPSSPPGTAPAMPRCVVYRYCLECAHSPARARAAWFAAACVRVVCACVRSGEVQRPLCPSGRRPANSGFYAWPWIPMIRVFTPCRESFSYPIAVHVRTCAHSGRPNN